MRTKNSLVLSIFVCKQTFHGYNTVNIKKNTNGKISGFVNYNEAIIYMLLYILRDYIFRKQPYHHLLVIAEVNVLGMND